MADTIPGYGANDGSNIPCINDNNMVIVFVTMSLWDEPHRGRHHFANILSKNHSVIWINRNLKKSEKKSGTGIEHIRDGLYVLHTGYPVISPRWDSRLNVNVRFRHRQLQSALKKLGLQSTPDLVWIYDYRAHNFTSYYRPKTKALYFCNDYFGEAAYNRFERKLAGKVDFVFCTAPALKERFEHLNNNTIFLPHGVHLPDISPRFSKKKKPSTAGYVGTFRNVIDVSFLKKIAAEADTRLILAGPFIGCSSEKRKELESLFDHERVEYRGNLTGDGIFRTIKELDVCLLPYEISFKTKHNFVIKYFEYLALGKPMLATPYFNWPEPYASFVTTASNGYNAAELLERVYSDWTESKFRQAVELAKNNTWQHRIDTISEYTGLDL